MTTRTAILIGIIIGVVTACGGPAYAADPNETRNWAATAYGSDDMLGLRVGMRPWGGRTELGLFGMWLDGLAAGDAKSDSGSNQQECFGGGVYGTYDVVQQAEFTIIKYQMPIDIYIGGQLGMIHRADSDEDATAMLMTGLAFGDGGIRIGVEYSYALTRDYWKEFADIDDKHNLFLTLGIRF